MLDFASKLPQGERIARSWGRLEASIKAMLAPGALFEQLGFRYIGPMDGHEMDDLIHIFRQVKELSGPILVHVLTQKGKGYPPAEKNATLFHGVGSFEKSTGKSNGKSKVPSYTSTFGKTLVELAAKDKSILAITAAMTDGTGLTEFSKKFPQRFFDVGIAEGHAVTFAAGLAAQGYRPVVSIYSTFLQRSYDQVIHDVSLQKLPVIFAMDRAGLVGEDGPTHHGCFDLSYMRHIPGVTILVPKDENELRHMLKTAVAWKDGPVMLRYPRGSGVGCPLDPVLKPLEIGKGEVAKVGSKGAILTLGPVFWEAMQAAQLLEEADLPLTVVNMRTLKPLDIQLLRELGQQFDHIMTIEEGVVKGGFGSAVLEAFSEMDIEPPRVKCIGIPDRFIEQGSRSLLLQRIGLDFESIADTAKQFFTGQASRFNSKENKRSVSKPHDIRHHRQHPDDEDMGRSTRLSKVDREQGSQNTGVR